MEVGLAEVHLYFVFQRAHTECREDLIDFQSVEDLSCHRENLLAILGEEHPLCSTFITTSNHNALQNVLKGIRLVCKQVACETLICLIICVDLAVSSKADRLASPDGFEVLEPLRGQSNSKLVQAPIRDLEDFHFEVADRVHVGFAEVVL